MNMRNHVGALWCAGLTLAFVAASTTARTDGSHASDAAAHAGKHAQSRSTGEKTKDAVDHRHDEATGVDQNGSVHHFVLEARGGSILLEVTDPGDVLGRDRIRTHLSHIASAFAQGDFALPMLIHDRTPPGVPQMKAAKSRISYSYEDTPRGGRVRITTDDARALAAVHAFLRFQIEDHRTGDPLDVTHPR